MFEKIKNWAKEHKVEIFVGIGAIGLVGAGIAIGKSFADADLKAENIELDVYKGLWKRLTERLDADNKFFYVAESDIPVHIPDDLHGDSPVIRELLDAAEVYGTKDAVLHVVMVPNEEWPAQV